MLTVAYSDRLLGEMSSTTKTTKTNAKSNEAKSGQKRRLGTADCIREQLLYLLKQILFLIDEAAEVLSAPDTPKALWSSPVGPRSSGLSHRCSDFQNKFKEPIFDELRDPVDMANNSKPVLGRIESAGAVDLRVSTGDALAPPTLAQVSSTRSVSIGCNGNNINTHADSSTVRSEPDHSPVINAGTPSPRPEPASTFSYNGPTFGVQMTAPLKLTSTASFGSGVKTDPLNPWYLSQGTIMNAP